MGKKRFENGGTQNKREKRLIRLANQINIADLGRGTEPRSQRKTFKLGIKRVGGGHKKKMTDRSDL